jgi:pyruvate dehydrogenase E1 component beta subunit
MNYKQTLNQAMQLMAQNKKTVFIGYNVRVGRAGGTLEEISDDQLIETPVAENLMVGMAIGMSLNGHYPIVYFERFDFIMNAMDAIINHLDKIELISDGEFKPAVIVRCVVGNKNKPLYTGPTHIQDFSPMFTGLNISLISCYSTADITEAYKSAFSQMISDKPKSSIVVEYKDLY